MQTLTKRLRDKRRDFAGSLDAILRAAEGVGELSHPELRKQVDDVHAFLLERFIPQAWAEGQAIYPRVERPLAAPQGSELMARDHAEIRRLAEKLGALRERLVYSYFGPTQLRSLREVLYDLHGLIELHLAKEDEFYLMPVDQPITAE